MSPALPQDGPGGSLPPAGSGKPGGWVPPSLRNRIGGAGGEGEMMQKRRDENRCGGKGGGRLCAVGWMHGHGMRGCHGTWLGQLRL